MKVYGEWKYCSTHSQIRHDSEVNVQLYPGGKLPPQLYTLNRRLGGPQILFGRFEAEITRRTAEDGTLISRLSSRTLVFTLHTLYRPICMTCMSQ